MHQAASKETLAHWVSLALKKALTQQNIRKGFSATRIYPLNADAMAKHLAPSEVFTSEFDIHEGVVTTSTDIGERIYTSRLIYYEKGKIMTLSILREQGAPSYLMVR